MRFHFRGLSVGPVGLVILLPLLLLWIFVQFVLWLIPIALALALIPARLLVRAVKEQRAVDRGTPTGDQVARRARGE